LQELANLASTSLSEEGAENSKSLSDFRSGFCVVPSLPGCDVGPDKSPERIAVSVRTLWVTHCLAWSGDIDGTSFNTFATASDTFRLNASSPCRNNLCSVMPRRSAAEAASTCVCTSASSCASLGFEFFVLDFEFGTAFERDRDPFDRVHKLPFPRPPAARLLPFLDPLEFFFVFFIHGLLFFPLSTGTGYWSLSLRFSRWFETDASKLAGTF
jgi:hypothetical protein